MPSAEKPRTPILEVEGLCKGFCQGDGTLEENGVPDFYELVIITNFKEIEEDRASVGGFMRGLSRGIQLTLEQPEKAFEIFLGQHADLKNELNQRSFEATLPFFKGSPGRRPFAGRSFKNSCWPGDS